MELVELVEPMELVELVEVSELVLDSLGPAPGVGSPLLTLTLILSLLSLSPYSVSPAEDIAALVSPRPTPAAN